MTPIAITMGDPCGIGPEITLKACADPRRTVPVVVIGDVGGGDVIVELPLARESELAFRALMNMAHVYGSLSDGRSLPACAWRHDGRPAATPLLRGYWLVAAALDRPVKRRATVRRR